MGNGVDLDKTPRSEASDLSLYCLKCLKGKFMAQLFKTNDVVKLTYR